VNHHLIPVNASRCSFHSYHRDGAMRVDGNHGSTLGDAPREVKIRHVGNCLKADSAYGKGVAKALGIPLSDVPKEA
jgi:catalase